ncbi:hypothetical protein P153DRAFT_375874 [Dothidotthia symphoricarpi CBS 119687]|uniref:Uncharacterized protein n=1 Tax=Dothidotthia symphoricarpi CBS 119687 TaxID=1392245 RepID=A0A6A6AG47_9PLEO|nr:uncharacterized protein P153DRAFT_375874 [Dothidotthia symphoricarpi CBS 119687]KAF2129391.1 hypothetical protein P153DRAFT_375874 [Dothidotthia symphoricarpi CBS 119687]
MAMPMGFAAQIKVLQETQREQAERIAFLEQENAELKASEDQNLVARIDALERHNVHLTARRKEAVAQLLNLRTLHQEANNAFHLRSIDIQPDDLEGVLVVYGTSITSVVNHHQRALAHLSVGSQLAQTPMYSTTAPYPRYINQGCLPTSPMPIGYAYPAAYAQSGYCLAHNIPYPCRMCDR